MPDEASVARADPQEVERERWRCSSPRWRRPRATRRCARTLHAVVTRDADVLSIAVRRTDGEVVARDAQPRRATGRPPPTEQVDLDQRAGAHQHRAPGCGARSRWPTSRPRRRRCWAGCKLPQRAAHADHAEPGLSAVLPVPEAHLAALGPQRRHPRSGAHRLRCAVRRGAGDRQAKPGGAGQPCVPRAASGRRARSDRQEAHRSATG